MVKQPFLLLWLENKMNSSNLSVKIKNLEKFISKQQNSNIFNFRISKILEFENDAGWNVNFSAWNSCVWSV